MELVSVVIPSYRHEKYISACLDSVHSQSYPDIELLVIDDQSNDRTYEIAADLCSSQEYRERFIDVRCLRNEKNLGAHASLNKGIALAKGKYISLLNSDDQYHADRIKLMHNALQEGGGTFSFSNYVFVNDEGVEDFIHPLYLELQSWIQAGNHSLPSFEFAFLQRQIALSTGNFFFERDLHETLGGFKDLKYCHDWDFILQAIRITRPIFVDQPLYRYRIHASNSFGGLAHVADAETESCLSGFFKACVARGVENRMAPTPNNWPGVCLVEMARFNLLSNHQKAVTGYFGWHRTVDKL